LCTFLIKQFKNKGEALSIVAHSPKSCSQSMLTSQSYMVFYRLGIIPTFARQECFNVISSWWTTFPLFVDTKILLLFLPPNFYSDISICDMLYISSCSECILRYLNSDSFALAKVRSDVTI